MKIAILGATSQIAQDLIKNFAGHDSYELYLYARQPDQVKNWVLEKRLPNIAAAAEYAQFGTQSDYDVIINFVGVGDPAKALNMGADILEITARYDTLALNHIQKNPHCKYIFLSSGAAYGGNFAEPADENTVASFPINQLGQQDWYGISKMYAETRHRALPHLNIADVRVFNYLSESQNLNARFFMTDLIRAIQSAEEFKTNELDLVRDYLSETDFHQLIQCIIQTEKLNDAIDCYTQKPVSKFEILKALEYSHGLQFELLESVNTVNSTGVKLNYYSKSKKASLIGYTPQLSSMDNIQACLTKLSARNHW